MSIWMTNLRAPGDRILASQEKTDIPSMLYQTWFEKRVHRLFMHHLHKFWDLNPELQIKLFDDNECDAFMAEHWGNHPIYRVYRGAQFGPLKIDIFRYCLIYTHGGYYCDISKGVLTRWTALHPSDASGVVSYEKNEFLLPVTDEETHALTHPHHFVCNWAFGFAPRHPFLLSVIDKIVALSPQYDGVVFEQVKPAIVTFTGPGVFTHCFHAYVVAGTEPKVHESGINFHGYGKMNLRGSRLRFLRRRSYKKIQGQRILIMD